MEPATGGRAVRAAARAQSRGPGAAAGRAEHAQGAVDRDPRPRDGAGTNRDARRATPAARRRQVARSLPRCGARARRHRAVHLSCPATEEFRHWRFAMGQFDGRVVIVTGGGIGIGAAHSRGFAGEGAQVVVADLDEAAAKALAVEINGLAVKVDVSDEESTKAMAKAAFDRYGRIDVLINNAGLFSALLPMKPWTEISVKEWDWVMSVNVRGTMLAARAVFPYMKAQGKGRIINTSSNTALSGVPFLLHYVSSKGAVISMTRARSRALCDIR